MPNKTHLIPKQRVQLQKSSRAVQMKISPAIRTFRGLTILKRYPAKALKLPYSKSLQSGSLSGHRLRCSIWKILKQKRTSLLLLLKMQRMNTEIPANLSKVPYRQDKIWSLLFHEEVALSNPHAIRDKTNLVTVHSRTGTIAQAHFVTILPLKISTSWAVLLSTPLISIAPRAQAPFNDKRTTTLPSSKW